jgi:hypothetical protein
MPAVLVDVRGLGKVHGEYRLFLNEHHGGSEVVDDKKMEEEDRFCLVDVWLMSANTVGITWDGSIVSYRRSGAITNQSALSDLRSLFLHNASQTCICPVSVFPTTSAPQC